MPRWKPCRSRRSITQELAFIGAGGGLGTVQVKYNNAAGLAAQLQKLVGGPTGLVKVADDSGHYIIFNKNAAAMDLPSNFTGSIMAGQTIRGDCVVAC
jgi:hypothetical protein